MREVKNVIRKKETVACFREKDLALPSGRDLRKKFREEGDL